MSSSSLLKTGYTLTPRVLPCALIAKFHALLPALFGGAFPTGAYPDEWHYRPGMSKENITREMCNAWKSHPLVAGVVLNEALGRRVCSLMGWSSCRVGQDDVIWKRPHQESQVGEGESKIGFHQDSAYISSNFVPYHDNSCTVWIALDHSSSANGGVSYADGSNTWPGIHLDPHTGARVMPGHSDSVPDSDMSVPVSDDDGPQALTFMSTDPYLSPLEQHIARFPACAPLSLTTPIVAAGHALVHHQDTWHGSAPNTSATDRRAIAIHFLRGDIKFAPRVRTTAPWGHATYIYGRYRRFESDDLDQSFFPLTYSDCGQRSVWIDEYVASAGVDFSGVATSTWDGAADNRPRVPVET